MCRFSSLLVALLALGACHERRGLAPIQPPDKVVKPSEKATLPAPTLSDLAVGSCGGTEAVAGPSRLSKHSELRVASGAGFASEVIRVLSAAESANCANAAGNLQKGCAVLEKAPMAACVGAAYQPPTGQAPVEEAVERGDAFLDVEVNERFFVAGPATASAAQSATLSITRRRFHLHCESDEPELGRPRNMAVSDLPTDMTKALAKHSGITREPHRVVSATIEGFEGVVHFVHATLDRGKTLQSTVYIESAGKLVEVERSTSTQVSRHILHHFCALPHGLSYPAAAFRLPGESALYLATVRDQADELVFQVWSLTTTTMEKAHELEGRIPYGKF
jgi:hypothetical protein